MGADEPVVKTALAVAEPFGAHIEFLHVRVDIARAAIASDGTSIAAAQLRLDKLDTEETGREASARATVDRLCRAAKVAIGDAAAEGRTATFSMETGDAGEWVAAYGRFADLVVVGRETEEPDAALEVIETTLLSSGRPILIANTEGAFAQGGTAIVAWSDTPQTLRAIHAAKPFLAKADRVVIVCADPDAAQEASAEQLRRALRWCNAQTTVEAAREPETATMELVLRCAADHQAGLVVMGGYSHSPLREFLFGGSTKSVLRSAAIPVLMAH